MPPCQCTVPACGMLPSQFSNHMEQVTVIRCWWSGIICRSWMARLLWEVLCVFVFIPHLPHPGFHLESPSKWTRVTFPLTHPPNIVRQLDHVLLQSAPLFIKANLCCRETLCPIQLQTFAFKHHPSSSWIPLALKKDPGSLKSGPWSWAIQGVSSASRSARLLNAKQTVEQIKIKGSSLACLACCPHMPSGAVTVSHGLAASVLMLTPLLHHLRDTIPSTPLLLLCASV